MDAGEETKLCPNCKHQISSTNFALHTVHCQRSLTVCPKCDEAIPRTLLSDHMESAHKEVLCPLCHIKVENCQLEYHQSELCAKRLIKCEYCEVECHASELQEHEDYCGSRTELCETCGQYILIKDEAVHIASGHAPKDRNRNKQDNISVSKEAMESAFNAVHTNRPKVPNIDRDAAARQSPTKRSNDMPQINTQASLNTEKQSAKPVISDSQFKREALDQLLALQLAENSDYIDAEDIPFFLQNSLSSHDDESARGIQYPTDSINGPEYEPDVLWDYDSDGFISSNQRPILDPPEQSINADTDISELLPCEFCGELCSGDFLVQHESGCRPDLAHGAAPEIHTTQAAVIPGNLDSERRFSIPPANIGRKSIETHTTVLPMSSDEDMIPCEICGEHYPSELLNEHQSLCPENEQFSNVRFDLPEADRGLLVRPHDALRENESNTVEDDVILDDNFMAADDMIPCEICGENFPSEVLIEHQNFCANFKEPVESADVNVPHLEVQAEQKENVPTPPNRVKNGFVSHNVEKPNTLKAIGTKKEPQHRPQHVKFGALPNVSTYRQPHTVNSTPSFSSHPRVRNVPVSVASDYHYPSHTYAKNSPSYPKLSNESVGLHSGGDFGKPSPAVNSYVRETKKAMYPVKEALRQETAKQSMKNSGTGTRPKGQTTKDDASFGLTRQQNQPEARFSRYALDTKRRETEPSIPSYLRSSSGDLEEQFKSFLASRKVPARIGQYHSPAPAPHQRTVAQASGDRRSNGVHDNSRLPPIIGTGAVPKKKDSRKGNDE